MVATASRMIELGASAPNFSLPDQRAETALVSLQDFTAKPLLVMFICNHCPYVIHVIEPLVKLVHEYQAQGLSAIAISSNDVINYPQDNPDRMREFAAQYGFQFPYCYDQSQQVARDFGAECTPDFFLYDADHRLRYRGQMDGSRPANEVPVTGSDLRAAIQALLAGQSISKQQIPSIGCNIKWKD